MSNFETELPDTMLLLAGERLERHAGERFVALAQFFAWVAVPDDPDLLEHTKHVAAARLYRSVERDLLDLGPISKQAFLEEIGERYLQRSLLLKMVVRRTVPPTFEIELDRWDAQTAADIVRFFLQVEENRAVGLRAPTMNRAMRFVEDIGYGIFDKQPSSTKIKAIWATCARTAPILAADWHLETFFSSHFPDSPKYHRVFKKAVQPGLLKHVLGSARYVQARCSELMHPDTLEKIVFPLWPDCIQEVPVSFGPFNTAQLAKIYEYNVLGTGPAFTP